MSQGRSRGPEEPKIGKIMKNIYCFIHPKLGLVHVPGTAGRSPSSWGVGCHICLQEWHGRQTGRKIVGWFGWSGAPCSAAQTPKTDPQISSQIAFRYPLLLRMLWRHLWQRQERMGMRQHQSPTMSGAGPDAAGWLCFAQTQHRNGRLHEPFLAPMAAPGIRETLPRGGGLRPSPLGSISRAPGAATTAQSGSCNRPFRC